jgi:hypothetical protein
LHFIYTTTVAKQQHISNDKLTHFRHSNQTSPDNGWPIRRSTNQRVTSVRSLYAPCKSGRVFDQADFCDFKYHYKKQQDVLCSFVLISQAIGLICFIILILHLDSASKGKEHQDYFLGGKGGRCVVLATLSPSCADCLEFWEPHLAGAIRACPGL